MLQDSYSMSSFHLVPSHLLDSNVDKSLTKNITLPSNIVEDEKIALTKDETIEPSISNKKPISKSYRKTPPEKKIEEIHNTSKKRNSHRSIYTQLSCIIKNKNKLNQLLNFMKKKRIFYNNSGNVIADDHVLPDTNFFELVCDAINGTRKKLPRNYKAFYKTLKKCNVESVYLAKSRRIYLN